MSTFTAGSSVYPEENMTTTAADGSTSEALSEYSSGEDGQTSCIDSDLQELYDSFDFDDENPAAISKTDLVTSSSQRFNLGNGPLYAEARLTSLQSSLLVFQYAIRHSLTTKAFTELLQLLSVHLPKGASIPKSVYQLKQNFLRAFPESQAILHYFCECCKTPLSTLSSDDCGQCSPATFITVPLGPQVKKMMEG